MRIKTNNKLLMLKLNLQNIDVKGIVKNLVSLTPLVFLVVGFASFLLFGLFEGTYYYSITHTVIKQRWLSTVFCISFPTILESGQFAFMMATIWNFTNRTPTVNSDKWLNVDAGLLFSFMGLVATGLIIWFKLGELNNMVDFWKSGEYSPYIKSALQFLIIIGIIFEVRIIMILSDKK